MPSNHLILCRPLLLLPSVFLSIRVFSPLDFQNFSYLLSSRSYIVKFHHLFSKFFKAICKVLLICSIFDSFQGLLHLKQTKKKSNIFITGQYFNIGLHWWLSDKESACNTEDAGLIPGWGRSPQRRKQQPTPVFLPGKSHGERSLVGYSPWGHKQSDTA